MVLQLEKKSLIQSVAVAARFADTKSTTLPSLTGILFIAGDDGIKIRATNLETAITLDLSGTITEEGVALIPAHTLRDICASLDPEGMVTLKKEGDTITLVSGKNKSVIKTLNADDFPLSTSQPEDSIKITFESEELQTTLQAVLPYASTSLVRPELASVLFTHTAGTLTLVATDSFRLAEKKVSLPNNTPPFTFLIPAKNIQLISSILPNEPITITLNEHQSIFIFRNGTITSRLVQGTYPDYKQIIPKTYVAEATFLKKDLEHTLRRISVFADTFQKITLSTSTEQKELTITAKNNAIGSSEEKIPGAVSGENATLSFNYKYLQAPLSTIPGDTITFSISGIGRAAVMRGAGDNSFLYLVMPMNQ